MINPNGPAIEYAALGKLIELATSISREKRRSKINKYLGQAAKIRYYLKALDDKRYLSDDTINRLYQCLTKIAKLNEIPSGLAIAERSAPTISVGEKGEQGERGERGEDGGGTDFQGIAITTNSVIDSFTINSAFAARWDYLIRSVSGQRSGTVIGTWTSDGLSVDWYETSTIDIIGDTSPVELTVSVFGTEVRFNAIVSSGQWDIIGSRYFIPNNGAGISPPTSLLSGSIWIGDTTNTPVARTIIGDVTISNLGVSAITAGSIVDADINATAAIGVNKLAALTANKAVITTGLGFLTTSIDASLLTYLTGVTSNIQTQLDSKIGSVTGAISPIVSANLTVNRALVSDPAGKIAVSGVTSTELGYSSGVTSSIQTQLNGKLNLTGGTLTGNLFTKSIQLDTNESLVLQGNGTISMGNGGISSNGGGQFLGGIATTASQFFIQRRVDIGDWNMHFSAGGSTTKAVAHGVPDWKKIRDISIFIRNDSDTIYVPLTITDGTGQIGGGVYSMDSTNITFTQTNPNLIFNNIDYNATGYNRGYVFITYEV